MQVTEAVMKSADARRQRCEKCLKSVPTSKVSLVRQPFPLPSMMVCNGCRKKYNMKEVVIK